MRKILDKVLDGFVDIAKFIWCAVVMTALAAIGFIVIFIGVVVDATALALFRAIRYRNSLFDETSFTWSVYLELLDDFVYGSED